MTDAFVFGGIVQCGAARSVILACERTRKFAKGASPAVFAAASIEFDKTIGERTFPTILTVLVAVTGIGVLKTVVGIKIIRGAVICGGAVICAVGSKAQ